MRKQVRLAAESPVDTAGVASLRQCPQVIFQMASGKQSGDQCPHN
jgi:hypothetical protein